MECISYKKGYKYQLVETYTVEIPIRPEVYKNSPSGFVTLSPEGILKIKIGYAWDGPSGPTTDTLNFMRGSLVHDALYQLMREGLLDNKAKRKPADRLLQKMCKEDGMSSILAWWVYKVLRIFGDSDSNPDKKRPVTKAPRGCGKNT